MVIGAATISVDHMRRQQDLPGETPAGYEVLAPIGDGAFGVVYRARQRSTGREVALKWVRAEATPREREDFLRERERCARLVHPNIVPLIDAGETRDGLWAAFAFVPGETLRALLARDGALDAREALHLCGQILDALGYAHGQGVVHRDLKPENVMITSDGPRRHALVLDFGLAGAVDGEPGEMLGTPSYAAPEQLRGERPTFQSDLYSWGLLLLECLTGRRAVRTASGADTVSWQLGPDVVELPAGLASHRLGALLRRATAKSLERRAKTAAEVLDELAALSPSTRAPDRGGEVDRTGTLRRQVTMISCRLEPLRAAAAGDAEDVDLALQEQHAGLAETAARYGGVRIATLAGRALFVFGYPHTRENEARVAVRAALEMIADVERTGPRLAARVGVHTGLALVRENERGDGACEPIGLGPEAAVRLDELAAPGEVLVSLHTQRLLRGIVGSEPLGEHDLGAGLGRMPVFRLVPAITGAGAETIRVTRETPLVARTAQLDALLDGWTAAQRGRSGFAFVTGEPGIGKTRLVRELHRRVPVVSWMETHCIPENQDSPLRPIADLLGTVVGDASLDVLAARHGLDPADAVPLLAELLGHPPDASRPVPPVSPDRRRELVLQTLTTLLLGLATERVIVLVVEDLHWADPTTLALLEQLLQGVGSAAAATPDSTPRLFLVCTARPTFDVPPGFAPTIAIPLSRLQPADVATMVGTIADATELPPGVLDDVVARADGIPLFVEEIARVLVEHDEGVEPDQRAAPVVPATLRDLLMARLEGLSRGARETAQLAATLGREFRWEHLRALASASDGVLREDLRELTDAGLVHQRARIRSERYVFKHALVRDAAYEAMSRAARIDAHDRVATTLEQLFPDVALDRPELLAHHCELAGRTVQAAEQWKRSGDRTMARGAYVESLRHFQRGLGLVEQAPARATLGALELGLVESLGTALLSTQGYASPEVESTFARAQAVCDRLGEEVPVRALHGIWGVHISRGNRDAVREILPRFHRMAERSGDPVSQLTAHAHTGLAAFLAGDFPAARTALAAAVPYYDSDGYRAFLAEYGYDGGLYSYAYLAWTAWITGDAAEARQVRSEMLALAARSRNPYGLAIALGFAANVAHGLGDVTGARDFSARAIAHATEQKLYLWLGPATCMHGWALVADGEPDAGHMMIQQGLGLFHMVGLRTTYPFHLALQAEAHLACGAIDAGLAAVDEGLGMIAEYVDRFYEAELRRLRGALLLARGDRDAGRADLVAAHALAERQGAPAFALRAALALATLHHADGDRAAACALLAAACAPQAPGGLSADEVAARARLAEWSA